MIVGLVIIVFQRRYFIIVGLVTIVKSTKLWSGNHNVLLNEETRTQHIKCPENIENIKCPTGVPPLKA